MERNRTTLKLSGNIFIDIAARFKLSPQMAEPCKERYEGLKSLTQPYSISYRLLNKQETTAMLGFEVRWLLFVKYQASTPTQSVTDFYISYKVFL